jgi:DNA-binding SARP family transcriptional activator
MSSLWLNLLGSFGVYLDGEPIDELRSSRVQALLIYLAVERSTTHRREYLFTLLWPGMPEKSARHNLSQTLYALRQTFPAVNSDGSQETVPLILANRQTIQLNPEASVDTDIHQLDRLLEESQTHIHLNLEDCQPCVLALEQAVALYQGDFLADFYLEDSSQFEDWATSNREAYRHKTLEALQTLTDIAIQKNAYDQASAYAERQLAIDKLNESAHCQLMDILARSDRRVEALRQYRTCVKILGSELGVAPSQETTALYERIRMESVQHSKPQMAVPVSLPTPLQPTAILHSAESTIDEEPALFFGRERELDHLACNLAHSLAGQGQVVFITGEPGQGKTALMAAFARSALADHPDLMVAQGNCNAFSGLSDPYLPFREVLSQLTGDVAGQYSPPPLAHEQARRLWATAPIAMQRLVNHGSYLVDTLVASEALMDRARSFSQEDTGWVSAIQAFIDRPRTLGGDFPKSALFEQYANVLRQLAAVQPLLVLLDDLQWADQGSLHLLTHLGQRLAAARVCLLCAYRSEEVALRRDGERHPLVPVLHEFKRRFREVAIDLQEADNQTGQTFVDAVLDAEPNQLGPEFREQLFERTRGHPLFTMELMRAMQTRGDLVCDPDLGWITAKQLQWEHLPARVEAVITERVDRLDDRLRGILAVASVEGENFTGQVVAQVEDLPERTLFQALSQELVAQHNLVRESREVQVGGRYLTRYRFTHALFQEYFYKGLGSGERRLLHGEVAAALEALYAGQTDQILAELAHHYAEGGWVEQAVNYQLKAGEAAAASCANEEAVTYFNRALALAPENDLEIQWELVLAREQVYNLQGQREFQTSDLAILETLAKKLREPGKQAEVALRQSNFAQMTSNYSTAVTLAQRSVRWAQEAGDREQIAAGYLAMGSALLEQGTLIKGREYLDHALELAQEAGVCSLVGNILNNIGMAAWEQGDLRLARGYLEQALDIFRTNGDQQGEGEALANLGTVTNNQGDYSASQSYLEQALVFSRTTGNRNMEGWSLHRLGWLVRNQGDYSTVQDYFEQALDIFREIKTQHGESSTLIELGILSYHLGNYPKSQSYIEKGLVIACAIGHGFNEAYALFELGRVAYYKGDIATARDYAEQALVKIRARDDTQGVAYALMSLGDALAELEQWAEAQTAFLEAIDLREELGQAHLEIVSRAGLARLALAQDDPDEAKSQANLILEYLDSGNHLESAADYFRISLTLFQVLQANEDPRAQAILTTSYNLLQERAAKISDEALRQSFLENVPWHKEIVCLWESRENG